MLLSDPYETKVLDRDVHDRLVLNLDTYRRRRRASRALGVDAARATSATSRLDYVKKIPAAHAPRAR